MKYKKFLIGILVYIFCYLFVFEALVSYYDFDPGNEIFTPLGRIVRKLVLNERYIDLYYYGDLYIFLFNLFISAILFYVANRWYGKENGIKTLVRLIVSFIIINIIIIIVYTFIDNRLAIIFIYVVYFLFPMSIMLMLLLPLFLLNKKIAGRIFIKNKNSNI